MTAPTKPEADWRALREWLIRARTSAKKVADTAFDPGLQSSQEAKWIAYSRVLDQMDERERQPRCGTCHGGGLVPAADCTCQGPHTCTPRVCPDCGERAAVKA